MDGTPMCVHFEKPVAEANCSICSRHPSASPPTKQKAVGKRVTISNRGTLKPTPMAGYVDKKCLVSSKRDVSVKRIHPWDPRTQQAFYALPPKSARVLLVGSVRLQDMIAASNVLGDYLVEFLITQKQERTVTEHALAFLQRRGIGLYVLPKSEIPSEA